MAEAVGLASGIAGLVTIAMQISKLSYDYMSTVKSAHETQKQYIREVTGLTDVLLRSEEAVQNIDEGNIGFSRPAGLSQRVMEDVAEELEKLCSQLRKPSPSIFWPIKEKNLRKQIEDLHRFRSIFTDFLAAQNLVVASATHRGVSRLSNHQDQKDLLEWLGSPKRTSGTVPNPLSGTGEWLLESDTYKQWAAESGPPLHWCHGPPGVGKSMLAAVILHHLNTSIESFAVLHYFFDFVNRKEQTKEAIWKDLLCQIIATGHVSVIQALTGLRKQSSGLHRSASPEDVYNALKTVCTVQQFFLVLDGPDEMENPRGLKTVLAPLVKGNCRVLITSRDIPEIRSTLDEASNAEVQADEKDLRAYLASRFEENGLEDVMEQHPHLERDILDKSQGMQVFHNNEESTSNHLVELSTVKEMRQALKVYPDHLEKAFESSLERIDAQSKSQRTLAHRVMGWIISAERKLQMAELIHGLATEEDCDELDDENLVSPKTLLKVCGGLVVIQGGSVSMVHSTVHTWLCNRYNGLYHGDIADSCLRYLTMRTFAGGVAHTAEEMDTRMETFVFLSYAALFWRKHLDETVDLKAGSVDRLLDNPGLRAAAFQASHYKNSLKSTITRTAVFETIPSGHTALHFASYWNLPEKITSLLFQGEDKNATDTQMWTPLHWACFSQSQEAVEILIAHKADTNARDSVNWTPVFWAALNGNTKTVKLLLDNGASHMARDVHDWTALRWAVASLQTDVVKALLEHHSNSLSGTHHNEQIPAPKDLSYDEARRYFTPHLPTDTKRDLIDELQGSSVDISNNRSDYDDLVAVFQEPSFNMKDLWVTGRFDPPVGNEWRTASKLNPPSGRSVDIDDSSRRKCETAASWKSRMLLSAIRDGKLLALRLLLEAGANVGAEADVQSALHTATLRKDPRFAEILIEYGADMEARNPFNFTPLQQAAFRGFEEVCEILLSKGANANAYYSFLERDRLAACHTPLMLVCGLKPESGTDELDLQARMVRTLLKYGADPNIKDGGVDGTTALHHAAMVGDLRILRLLLDAGSNPRQLDNHGRTAIHYLILGRNGAPDCSFSRCWIPGQATECLTVLTERCGLDFVNKTCNMMSHWRTNVSRFFTPLSLAVLYECWEILEALRNLGAIYETNMPLDGCLRQPLLELQVSAVELLVENGATFPSIDGCSWVDELCLFSPNHKTTSDEVGRLKRILAMLIPRGLDIKAVDEREDTLLHHAIRTGSNELVECLLDAGADPHRENRDEVDAFLLACLSQQLDLLKILLGHSKNNTFTSHWKHHLESPEILGDESLFAAVCKALVLADQIHRPLRGGTILSQAAGSDNLVFVKELLTCGADPDLGDEKGRRPLHVAAEKGHTFIIETLVNSGAAVDVLDERQWTPLHYAVYGGHPCIVDTLLMNGATVDVLDDWQWTPLHYAAFHGRTETARLLLKGGASAMTAASISIKNPNYRDMPCCLRHGYASTVTPLHLAAMAGVAETVRLILEGTVDVDTSTAAPVQNAIQDGFYRVPTLGSGFTALHLALGTWKDLTWERFMPSKEELEIISMLVNRGASVEGAANHLRVEDIAKFEEFPELWDNLRAGITVE
ncbi:Putative NACHT nucleoside triphosphatase, P-loop containing nucleoside triphosphate hydrolase [Colletotrichum destructivum]|uniref:NACHT nucleoside triphosphatase, P-loop containing nucleoside triphosphate hydrolase n=1 Tax=Colletotrichum destructivum TaxID=34406 RepID=A0AAX4I000_9PEZI|nr:Putative NACHT nucleoside triphosphatase, P-loop containing nucleoside triphosphate hydrolase [Colletotrichum destructivum]